MTDTPTICNKGRKLELPAAIKLIKKLHAKGIGINGYPAPADRELITMAKAMNSAPEFQLIIAAERFGSKKT